MRILLLSTLLIGCLMGCIEGPVPEPRKSYAVERCHVGVGGSTGGARAEFVVSMNEPAVASLVAAGEPTTGSLVVWVFRSASLCDDFPGDVPAPGSLSLGVRIVAEETGTAVDDEWNAGVDTQHVARVLELDIFGACDVAPCTEHVSLEIDRLDATDSYEVAWRVFAKTQGMVLDSGWEPGTELTVLEAGS